MFIAAKLLVAALDIKTRDVPTVSSTNSLLSQYRKASNFFFAIFYVPPGGGAPTVRFAPVVLWAKTGPACTKRSAKHFVQTKLLLYPK
jgi:hypothetical protein